MQTSLDHPEIPERPWGHPLPQQPPPEHQPHPEPQPFVSSGVLGESPDTSDVGSEDFPVVRRPTARELQQPSSSRRNRQGESAEGLRQLRGLDLGDFIDRTAGWVAPRRSVRIRVPSQPSTADQGRAAFAATRFAGLMLSEDPSRALDERSTVQDQVSSDSVPEPPNA